MPRLHACRLVPDSASALTEAPSACRQARTGTSGQALAALSLDQKGRDEKVKIAAHMAGMDAEFAQLLSQPLSAPTLAG